jgi:phosphatidylglycerophosphate synthase
VVDSVLDRVGDALLLLAFWRCGAPGWSCVVGGAAIVLLEYTRARAGNAGMAEVGVVTIAERPTRFVIAVIGLLVAGIVTKRSDDAGEIAALATAGVCFIGWLQLSVVVVRRLRQAPPPS